MLTLEIFRLWWQILDSNQLAPYWPTNPGDGHTIGPFLTINMTMILRLIMLMMMKLGRSHTIGVTG